VRNVIEILIAQQKCETIEQQSVLDYEKLFKDPEFGPESKYNPIYFNNDLDEKTAFDLEFSLKKVTWMRPSEIAPKPKISGFTDLNVSNATPDEL
jgi:hypothetical protein